MPDAKLPCSVDECDFPLLAKGMCEAHYARARRGGPVNAPINHRGSKPKLPCSITGCERDALMKGMCRPHYDRIKNGSTLTGPIRDNRRTADEDRMSIRTTFRRRAEAGLTQAVFRFPWNDQFFDTWSDEVAWLLGLIWTDGYIRDNRIEVCSKDRGLMETVSELISMPDGVRPKNKGAHWYVTFCSAHASRRLYALGLTPAKSWTVPWPTELPEEHSAAFMRDMIDGDGTVCLLQNRKGQLVPDLLVELSTASERLALATSEWMTTRDLRHSVSKRGRNSVIKVVVSHQESLRRLHKLMYPNYGVVCLARKRAKYDRWMITPRRSTLDKLRKRDAECGHLTLF